MDMDYWSLKGFEPRQIQIEIIDKVSKALDMGYENIILEAGTGIGKSAIATTIANMVANSYILTMTNQLQEQYLHDFNYMLTEIKGRRNYICNYYGDCSDCYMDNQLSATGKPLPKCDDCEYKLALKKAQRSKNVLTNYDYLWYSGNYAKHWNSRDLLILDESHNFEKKIMSLVTKTLNRKTIYEHYDFDIFYPVTKGESLESIKTPDYWQGIVSRLIDTEEMWLNLKGDDATPKEKKTHTNRLTRYQELYENLDMEDWIIELPKKQEILSDATYTERGKVRGLKVEFKPLMINEYSNDLLKFGNKKLFLTGTLGNKQRFCHWNGIDQDETYYLYVKSPFPVEHRPIIKSYVRNMSGFTDKIPNWKTNNAIDKIKRIIVKHKSEKGVIHTSSNEQAWWIKNGLDSKNIWVVQGQSRAKTIEYFEKAKKPIVLVGAGIKDGVDFKGDKCRFQILFKMPKPSIASTQTIIRAKKDPVWYAYATVMPLMQSYGRGIRDETDYCTTYVLDSEFDNLLTNHKDLFNEYFLEAVQ